MRLICSIVTSSYCTCRILLLLLLLPCVNQERHQQLLVTCQQLGDLWERLLLLLLILGLLCCSSSGPAAVIELAYRCARSFRICVRCHCRFNHSIITVKTLPPLHLSVPADGREH
jgi:hypothetical protein